MKRLFFVLLTLFILTGCHEVTDITKAIDDTFALIESQDIDLKANHEKDYYAYYLPSGITNIESTDTYNILSTTSADIIVNIDIDKIIKDAYYSDVENVADVYALNEAYITKSGSVKGIAYELSVYNYNDKYLIELFINNADIITLVDQNNIDNVLYDMLIVGMSISTNNDLVINDFSSRDVIDYHQEAVDLFEIVIPRDGRLDELIKPNQNVVE